jgi:glucokinase
MSAYFHDNGMLTAKDIATAAQQGDALARRIIHSTGCRLGEAMAILVDVLNPERIVVGGLAVRLGESLLGPARIVTEREALAASAKDCQIVPAALGEQTGDIAAICVAMGFSRDVPRRREQPDKAINIGLDDGNMNY